MKKFVINAVRLRIILAVSLVLITIIGAGGFFFAYNSLGVYAQEASTVASRAHATEAELQELSRTEQLLKQQKTAVERASKIAAESKSYQYQDQIINDLNGFAGKAGLTIASITFTDNNAATSAGSSSSSSTSASTTTHTSTNTAGLKTTTATVALKNPVDYQRILTFMHLIEQSLTKMRIANIELSRTSAEGQPSGSITSNTLTIEVYLHS